MFTAVLKTAGTQYADFLGTCLDIIIQIKIMGILYIPDVCIHAGILLKKCQVNISGNQILF